MMGDADEKNEKWNGDDHLDKWGHAVLQFSAHGYFPSLSPFFLHASFFVLGMNQTIRALCTLSAKNSFFSHSFLHANHHDSWTISTCVKQSGMGSLLLSNG